MEIPENLKPLFDIVGAEKALEIIKVYEGSSVYFSKSILKEYYKGQMIQEYHSGLSYKALSEKYGYVISYVRQLCNKR